MEKTVHGSLADVDVNAAAGVTKRADSVYQSLSLIYDQQILQIKKAMKK